MMKVDKDPEGDTFIAYIDNITITDKVLVIFTVVDVSNSIDYQPIDISMYAHYNIFQK